MPCLPPQAQTSIENIWLTYTLHIRLSQIHCTIQPTSHLKYLYDTVEGSPTCTRVTVQTTLCMLYKSPIAWRYLINTHLASKSWCSWIIPLTVLVCQVPVLHTGTSTISVWKHLLWNERLQFTSEYFSLKVLEHWSWPEAHKNGHLNCYSVHLTYKMYMVHVHTSTWYMYIHVHVYWICTTQVVF